MNKSIYLFLAAAILVASKFNIFLNIKFIFIKDTSVQVNTKGLYLL